jgi:hypothetical protein
VVVENGIAALERSGIAVLLIRMLKTGGAGIHVQKIPVAFSMIKLRRTGHIPRKSRNTRRGADILPRTNFFGAQEVPASWNRSSAHGYYIYGWVASRAGQHIRAW